MVFDQLLLGSSLHSLEWVEGTFEISLEGIASLNNLVHDLKSLVLGDTWAEWVASKVSSNSDSGRFDHSGISLLELGVLDALGVHLGGVGGTWSMTVIVFDDLVEELGELSVGIVRSGIKSDSGVEVLDTREDAGLESDTLSA